MANKVELVQVSNVSLTSTTDQFYALFSNVGPIEEYVMYPRQVEAHCIAARVGYIRFKYKECSRMAVHLTNTMFLEKALIVSYVCSNRIPLESEALKYCAPLDLNVTLIAGGPSWDSTMINKVIGQGADARIQTIWPLLDERGLPPFPELSGTLDYAKAEETRRTVYVENIPEEVSLDILCQFLSQIGEIRFIREAIEDGHHRRKRRAAYVEFSDIESVANALCLNGIRLRGVGKDNEKKEEGIFELRVHHSPFPIIKSASLLTDRDLKLLNWQKSPTIGVRKTGRRSPSKQRRRSGSSNSSNNGRYCSGYRRRLSPRRPYRPPPYRYHRRSPIRRPMRYRSPFRRRRSPYHSDYSPRRSVERRRRSPLPRKRSRSPPAHPQTPPPPSSSSSRRNRSPSEPKRRKRSSSSHRQHNKQRKRRTNSEKRLKTPEQRKKEGEEKKVEEEEEEKHRHKTARHHKKSKKRHSSDADVGEDHVHDRKKRKTSKKSKKSSSSKKKHKKKSAKKSKKKSKHHKQRSPSTSSSGE